MKKLLFLFSAGILLAGCGGEKSDYDKYYEGDYKADTTSSGIQTGRPAARATEEPAVAGQFAKGLKLINSSDCKSCHQNDQRVVGPAYKDVADKYEETDENIDYLALKVINGGSGVWGEIAMNPHPNVSEADAKEMVKYILSLNDSN